MKTSKIDALPLKKLDWKKLVPAIGVAREALARLDERSKDVSASELKKLCDQEAVASIYPKNEKKILIFHCMKVSYSFLFISIT